MEQSHSRPLQLHGRVQGPDLSLIGFYYDRRAFQTAKDLYHSPRTTWAQQLAIFLRNQASELVSTDATILVYPNSSHCLWEYHRPRCSIDITLMKYRSWCLRLNRRLRTARFSSQKPVKIHDRPQSLKLNRNRQDHPATMWRSKSTRHKRPSSMSLVPRSPKYNRRK